MSYETDRSHNYHSPFWRSGMSHMLRKSWRISRKFITYDALTPIDAPATEPRFTDALKPSHWPILTV